MTTKEVPKHLQSGDSFNDCSPRLSIADSTSNHFERLRTESVLCYPPTFAQSISHCGENQPFILPPPITLSEDEVKSALLSEVRKHKSWRIDAVKRMRILRILSSSVFRYSLQSFLETRKTYEACESFNGDLRSEYGTYFSETSDPWDYVYEPRKMFVEEEVQVELPGTSKSNECTTCSGQGSNHCFHCRGSGTSRCSVCNGTGMKNGVPHPAVVTHPLVGGHAHHHSTPAYKSPLGSSYAKGTPAHFASIAGLPPPGVTAVDLCIMCHGTGIKQCYYCKGSGKKSCGLCGGSGKVRTCTKMKIKHTIVSDEYLHESTLPQEVIKNCAGDILFVEMKDRLPPLTSCPILAVNEQSVRMLNLHWSNSLGLSKIIQQRHMVESIPVTEVSYSLGGRSGLFWVLGNEKAAYIAHYPQKCIIL